MQKEEGHTWSKGQHKNRKKNISIHKDTQRDTRKLKANKDLRTTQAWQEHKRQHKHKQGQPGLKYYSRMGMNTQR